MHMVVLGECWQCSQRTIDNREGAGIKKHDDVRAAGRILPRAGRELADGAPCATDKNMLRRTDKKLRIERDSAPTRRDFTSTLPIYGITALNSRH